ncbi:MAG: HEAT repeat domain-containing protein, partial [Elainella sp.]
HLAVACHPEAIPTLIAALSYNNPGAAVAAVEGLVKLGTAAVPAILEQLDGHNYTARAWAIRALAEIGDPRGLTTLLGAATADFALSVRRAAAKGLGSLRWADLADEELEIAQAEALDALLFVCDDHEWVVRYAAVAGLEALALEIWQIHADWRSPILAKLDNLALQDPVLAIRGRACLAQQRIGADQQVTTTLPATSATVEHIIADWQVTLQNLYARKSQQRPLPEGDPRRFKHLAANLAQPNAANLPE